uniref:Glycoside hydrolase family 38 N-terminal domain-containing protein n=1 Tax=Aegilops tauschii subsp. strangulata TaxID=200361 RepID=A0A453DJU0_AEGTS
AEETGACACTTRRLCYIDMIDQTTLGHGFINEEFSQIPRIGWQIDPLGHSAFQAYPLSYLSSLVVAAMNLLVTVIPKF